LLLVKSSIYFIHKKKVLRLSEIIIFSEYT
jgi:hypothetical protein